MRPPKQRKLRDMVKYPGPIKTPADPPEYKLWDYIRSKNYDWTDQQVQQEYTKRLNECKVKKLAKRYKDEYLYLSALIARYYEIMDQRGYHGCTSFPGISIDKHGRPYETKSSGFVFPRNERRKSQKEKAAELVKILGDTENTHDNSKEGHE